MDTGKRTDDWSVMLPESSNGGRNTWGEMTSQNLWQRHVRRFVGITWHNVLS